MNPIGKFARWMSVSIGCGLTCLPSLVWAQQGEAVDKTAAATVAAANSIDTLQVSQSDGVTIVKLTLKQPLAATPASFSIANPARLAFDFPDTSNHLARNAQAVNQGDLRSINIVQVGDRTRLVLNLNKMSPYETRLEGKVMYVTLASSATASTAASAASGMVASTQFAVAQPMPAAQSLAASGGTGIRDINFRRGKDGEARVVVDLSDANVGIDLQKQGKNLLATFKKVALPQKLDRRLDVTDFATPVTSVSTQVVGDSVQMTITPHGLWEYNAYQSDTQFVVEVRAVVESPNQLVQGGSMGAHGEKLSLNFQNIDVRAVLQVIADFTNFNIITSDTVSGNVTLRLKDVPWDQALDIILQSKGLGMRKNGNVIWIAPDKEIIDRDEYQSRSRQAMSIAEPMQTQTFRLSYAKVEDTIKLLSGDKKVSAGSIVAASGSSAADSANSAKMAAAANASEQGGYISSAGAVTMDVRTNQLFVTDYPRYLERIKKLIVQIDQPVRQVLIEARIVSAEDNFGRSLGARLGYNDLSSTVPGLGVGTRVGGTDTTYATVGGTLEGVFSQTGQATGGGKASGKPASLAQSTFVNLPAAMVGGTSPSTFAVSLFKTGLASFINLELQAAETDGRVKSIATPRVVTADARQAEIAQGVEIPYTVQTKDGPQTNFKKALLKLNVTPQITADGTVILDLDVSNDEVGKIFADGVSINTKNIKTKVTVENGGTVVLGGVYTQTELEVSDKVPLLGDLPVLGHLFKSSTRTQARKELLVFITPKIIDDQLQAVGR
jgi:type IV pilus assembly protein PilQ